MASDPRLDRRALLGALGAGASGALAGCALPGGGGDDGDGDELDIPAFSEFRGSGPLASGRPQPEGTRIEELPDLSGTLRIYLGGGEGGIYEDFTRTLEEIYPDFEAKIDRGGSSSLAQSVVSEVEADNPQADVFWSIDAGSLAHVAENDAAESLSADVVDPVPSSFRGPDDTWVGVAGRARSVPYNTNQLSAADVPTTVQEFPDTTALQGTMGWAPTYGAFKAFVTAMRLLRGADATRKWLVAMREADTTRYPNEAVVSNRVADGALAAGFANHYYAMRVKEARPDAPIDLAFTESDAGALVNVAGALRLAGSGNRDLAEAFVRHLLTAEAQEFFATVAYAYPMIPGVAPVGGLPTIDELQPPDVDLSALSDLEPTLEVMREAGVEG